MATTHFIADRKHNALIQECTQWHMMAHKKEKSNE